MTKKMRAVVIEDFGGPDQAKPAKVFRFDELPEAHRLMESNTANGKIVVVMD